MKKYLDLDLTAAINDLKYQTTMHDFIYPEIDRSRILEAAKSPYLSEKIWLWRLEPYLFADTYEHNAFMKNTEDNKIFQHMEHLPANETFAYTMEITGMHNDTVMGNLYELDIPTIAGRLHESKVYSFYETYTYQHTEIAVPYGEYGHIGKPEYGELLRIQRTPEEPEKLDFALKHEKVLRDQLQPGNFKEHIQELRNRRIENEAQRLTTKMQKHLQSSDRALIYATIPVSSDFQCRSTIEDFNSLSLRLPFQANAVTNPKNEVIIFATVSKDENRNKELRKSSGKWNLLDALTEKPDSKDKDKKYNDSDFDL